MVDLALPRRFRDMPIAIDITFPGPVIDAGGTAATGNQVTLTEGIGAANFSRTRVVALSHSGPQWWVIGLAAGFVVGVGLTLAFLLVLRRRRPLLSRVDEDGSRRPDHGPSASPPIGSATTPSPAPAPEPATDHRIWAPPADRGDR